MNIVDILIEYLGEPNKYPDHIDYKGNILFHCPNCISKHNTPHFSVNINGKYNCWICHFSGQPKYDETAFICLLRMLYKLGFKDVFSKYGNFVDNIEEILVDKKETFQKPFIPVHYKKIFKYYFRDIYHPGYRYLKNRFISDNDMIKYDIRYSPIDERIFFPSYDKNYVLNYHISRTIRKDVKPKYKNFDIIKPIINEHLIDWSRPLYLVEGIFDSIVSRENSTPLLGSSLSEGSQLLKEIVKNKTPIILALDYDVKNNYFNLMKKLLKYNINVSFIEWGECRQDIAAMGTEKFHEFIKNNVKKYSFYDEITYKLKFN